MCSLSVFFGVGLRMEDVVCIGVVPVCALAQNSPTLVFGGGWVCFDVIVHFSLVQ